MRSRLTAWTVAAFSVAVLVSGFDCSPSGSAASALDPVDTDGDGLSDTDEVNLYGTSPVLADTDGDGWSDSVEITKFAFDPANDPYRFNPRVADLPEEGLELTSPPIITIQLTATSGQVQSFETSRADTNTVASTQSTTTANASTQSLDTPVTVTQLVALSGPISPDGGSTPDTRATTNSVSQTIDPSTTVATSLSFTAEQSQENAATLQEAQTFEQSHELAAASGVMTLTAVMTNLGHVAFRVTNYALTATMVDGPAGVVAPIGNLSIDTPLTTYDEFSLAPGERTGPVNYIRTALTLDLAEALLRDASGIIVQVGTVTLSNFDGKPFAFNVEEIAAKTATIILDYAGHQPPERYQVATNLDPAHPGVTTGKAFEDILRIPFEADPKVGLTSVRGIAANASGIGHWELAHQHDDGGEGTTTTYSPNVEPYDFPSIVLHAGDVLHVGLVVQNPVQTEVPPPKTPWIASPGTELR